ncbi:hypothetical protein DS2_17822 [Catenovulum agarivorans DS-2]|uniref:Uncharacterized protein n=1 Tax=Catenovulum agarivorans DS-2 TaxID=1328313 RepID=W7Q6H4_9ALTE|nr:hypothetical protein [Catenovulum agarivorans]EWH08369.1 hypothetical protein DS2_17822 [Catenovulum agarivorans DS-2]
MEWLVDNKFYLNILFLILAVISFVLILRPILFWYFGQNKISDQIKSLQEQIDQQNAAIEKLLKKVESGTSVNQTKALPSPTQKAAAQPNNVVNITKDNAPEPTESSEVTEPKEVSTNKNSKSHFERKEPTLKL